MYEFEAYLGKKTKTEFGLGEPVVLLLSESLAIEVATVACLSTTFLQVQNWCWSCWKTRFMELKQSRQIKNVRFLSKQISKWKWSAVNMIGEHVLVFLPQNGRNQSVILLWNYHDPKAVHYIEWGVKGSKEKLKVFRSTVIHEYNQIHGWRRPVGLNESIFDID